MPRIILTRRVVRDATCPSGQPKIDLFDARQTGFLLKVRKSGGKTFYQRYIDARGRTRQFKIGAADVLGLSPARRKGRSIVAQALIGDDPQERRAELRSIPTLAGLVRDLFLPHIQSYKRSWRTDETVLRVHVLPILGAHCIDEIRCDAIAAIVQRMRLEGYASGTTNRVVIVLRHLFDLARKWRVPGAGDNPTAGIRACTGHQSRTVPQSRRGQTADSSIEKDENEAARGQSCSSY